MFCFEILKIIFRSSRLTMLDSLVKGNVSLSGTDMG